MKTTFEEYKKEMYKILNNRNCGDEAKVIAIRSMYKEYTRR